MQPIRIFIVLVLSALGVAAQTRVIQTTEFTRDWLRSTNATSALGKLQSSPTNAAYQTINFQGRTYFEGDFSTNAAFAWTGFMGLASTQYQTAVIWLTNTTGSAIAFTVPANCHTLGTLNVTNVTECVFKCSAGRWTNLLSLPLW